MNFIHFLVYGTVTVAGVFTFILVKFGKVKKRKEV